MYKVLIADDERLIRVTLKNMIDWAALDCEVIATVKDGKEAYRIFLEVQPQIVITDLKMPEMNGIELINKIKEKNKATQVIVLSNHSDFELVRDAMKAGAFDYLLKVTLEKSQLISIVEQVKQNCCDTVESAHDEKIAAIKQLQQCMVLTKNEHILDSDVYIKTLQLPIFQKYADYYQLAYFRVDNINVLYEDKYKDHDRLQVFLHDLIQESIPMSMEQDIIFISNHSGVLLFHSTEKLRVINICNSIIRNISQYLDVQISITLSDMVTSLQDYQSTYLQLLKAHELRFYNGEGILIQSEKKVDFQELKINELHFHIDFLEAIQAKNIERIAQLEEASIKYMKEQVIEPSAVLEYYIFIFNNIEGKEILKGTKQTFHFDKISTRIRKCETIDRLQGVIEESFTDLARWISDSSSNKYREGIMQIMEFVETKYTQKLTLKMIADKFDMSESSVSRIFKNDTGINLNYYINEKRMKKAVSLLSNSSYKIKDIAIMVGMEDQLYFNKVFKKYYQLSPSEYRKKLQNNLDSSYEIVKENEE